MKKNINYINYVFKFKTINGDLCLADSPTMHVVSKDNRYFSQLKSIRENVNTIPSPTDMIKGFKRANFVLPKGTYFSIYNILYSPISK